MIESSCAVVRTDAQSPPKGRTGSARNVGVGDASPLGVGPVARDVGSDAHAFILTSGTCLTGNGV